MVNHIGDVTEITSGVWRNSLSSLIAWVARYPSSSLARNNRIISSDTCFSTQELHHQYSNIPSGICIEFSSEFSPLFIGTHEGKGSEEVNPISFLPPFTPKK